MADTIEKNALIKDFHSAGFTLQDDGGVDKIYPVSSVFGADSAEFESLALQQNIGGAASRVTVFNETTGTLPQGKYVFFLYYEASMSVANQRHITDLYVDGGAPSGISQFLDTELKDTTGNNHRLPVNRIWSEDFATDTTHTVQLDLGKSNAGADASIENIALRIFRFDSNTAVTGASGGTSSFSIVGTDGSTVTESIDDGNTVTFQSTTALREPAVTATDTVLIPKNVCGIEILTSANQAIAGAGSAAATVVPDNVNQSWTNTTGVDVIALVKGQVDLVHIHTGPTDLLLQSILELTVGGGAATTVTYSGINMPINGVGADATEIIDDLVYSVEVPAGDALNVRVYGQFINNSSTGTNTLTRMTGDTTITYFEKTQ